MRIAPRMWRRRFLSCSPSKRRNLAAIRVWQVGCTPARPQQSDLGLWNVDANPNFPSPQRAIEQMLNADGGLSRSQMLQLTIGRFKTSTVRNLGASAPYLQSGELRTIEEVVDFYRRNSRLAHVGKRRNSPRSFSTCVCSPKTLHHSRPSRAR